MKVKTTAEFFSKLPKERRALAKELHGVLKKIQPKYEVAPAWGGLGYKLGKNYSCLVASYKDHVKLMIWRGIDLKDPKKILKGEGSNTRHVRIASEEEIDATYLKKLLKQQFKMYESGIGDENKTVKRRKRHSMPTFVKQALTKKKLMQKYKERPAYQQNDYIGWIMQGKRKETQEKRLQQMLTELAAGNVYMKMDWKKR